MNKKTQKMIIIVIVVLIGLGAIGTGLFFVIKEIVNFVRYIFAI